MQNNLENLPAGSVHVCWSGPRVSSLCTGRGWNCWIVLPCWKRTSQCCWAFCWSRRPVISWRTWSGSEYRDISLNHSSKEKQIFFLLYFTFFSFYILSILCISFLIKYLCSCPLYHSYPSYPIPIYLLSPYHFHPSYPFLSFLFFLSYTYPYYPPIISILFYHGNICSLIKVTRWQLFLYIRLTASASY